MKRFTDSFHIYEIPQEDRDLLLQILTAVHRTMHQEPGRDFYADLFPIDLTLRPDEMQRLNTMLRELE